MKFPVAGKLATIINFQVPTKIGYLYHFNMTINIYNSNIHINKEEVKGNGSII
jgi:hypothetical protein